MHRARLSVYWLWPVAVIVTTAVVSFAVALRLSHHDGAHVSETLGSRNAAAAASRPASAPPTPAPTAAPPPLIEVLQAADLLVKAGFLAPLPTSTDAPLIDVRHAAVALAQAGVLPPPPDTMASATAPEPRVVVSTPVPQRPAPPPAPSNGWYDSAYTAQVRDLVNAQRASFGLQAVAMEPRLTSAAADYARVLAVDHWFSHIGPDGSTLVTRVEAAGFPFTVQIGEILAWGTQSWSAPSVVQAWMNSPTHRQEILDPVYGRAGVSCYFTAAQGVTVYCVMDFAG